MVAPRLPVPTVQFIDSYCELYQNLFPEVRSFENFKYLHLGMISELKRKTLPAIAKLVGLDNEQSLHHFLTKSPWDAQELRKRRLEIILKTLQGRSIILIIDEYLLAIRSNHAVWLPREQKVRWNNWRKFERVFGDGRTETRYVREIIFGKRRQQQFWQITTDIDTLPDHSTWYVMSNIPGVKYCEVGNLYGLRTWVEYGLKQSKNELGWADFRVTNYAQIEKWWEMVMSAYLMVSLHSHRLNPSLSSLPEKFQEHELWDFKEGWKNVLNNLHLIIQPFVGFNFIKRWLKVFPIPQLSLGFPRLISLMNLFDICDFTAYFRDSCYRATA